MGRSSRAEANENRARILQAASDLFRAQGVEAVGIADVMKAAGMTQGGFYTHFSSKDALAAEACALAFEQAAARWRIVAAEAEKQGADIAAALAENYAAARLPSRTCPILAFAADAARRGADDPVQRSYGQGVRILFETFTDCIGGDGSPEGDARLRRRFAAMVGSKMLERSAQQPVWDTCAAAPETSSP